MFTAGEGQATQMNCFLLLLLNYNRLNIFVDLSETLQCRNRQAARKGQPGGDGQSTVQFSIDLCLFSWFISLVNPVSGRHIIRALSSQPRVQENVNYCSTCKLKRPMVRFVAHFLIAIK